MAAVILGEAGNQGADGMTAVAEVIANRAKAKKVSPLATVTRRYAFSCLNGVKPEDLIAKFENSGGWKFALELASKAVNKPEVLPGIAMGATHYYADYIKEPYWAKGEKPLVKIGRHIFYRVRF